jgi:hypothetical protein
MVTSVTTAIDDHTDSLTALNILTQHHTSDISDRNASLSALTTLVSQHTTDISGHTRNISALLGTTVQHPAELTGYSGRMSELQLNVSTDAVAIASKVSKVPDIWPSFNAPGEPPFQLGWYEYTGYPGQTITSRPRFRGLNAAPCICAHILRW